MIPWPFALRRMQRDNLGLFSVRENKRARGRLMPRLPSAWYHEQTIAHSITSTSNAPRCKGPHFLCRATAAISFHLTARAVHLRVRREMLLSRVLLDMTKAHPCAVATPMPHRVVSALMLLAKPSARGLDYSQSLDSFSSDRFARGERARFSKVTRSGRIQPIVEPTLRRPRSIVRGEFAREFASGSPRARHRAERRRGRPASIWALFSAFDDLDEQRSSATVRPA